WPQERQEPRNPPQSILMAALPASLQSASESRFPASRTRCRRLPRRPPTVCTAPGTGQATTAILNKERHSSPSLKTRRWKEQLGG
ncbi:hypothetical protein BGZ65_012680, partial [Modicella reniformis]